MSTRSVFGLTAKLNVGKTFRIRSVGTRAGCSTRASPKPYSSRTTFNTPVKHRKSRPTHVPMFAAPTRRFMHSSTVLQTAVAFDLPEIGEARTLLGDNKFVKAEPLLIRALDIAKYAVGEQSPAYIELVDMLARCKFARSSWADATKLYQTAALFYVNNSKWEDAKRALEHFSTAFLRAEDQISAAATLASLHKLVTPSAAPVDLSIRIALANIYVRSVVYHKNRTFGDHTAMESIQKDIDSIIDETSKLLVSETSILSSIWYLQIGRWNQTLFEIRKEPAREKMALESYNRALKVPIEPKRESELVKADALLGLGDLARLNEKWEDADEHYKKAIDLTDRYFDRDSQRVRRVIERESIVQYHIKRWLHAEGLLRRLLDYYQESRPLNNPIPQPQLECTQCYVKMMETRGRGSEVASLKTKLESIDTVIPSPTFDPYAL